MRKALALIVVIFFLSFLNPVYASWTKTIDWGGSNEVFKDVVTHGTDIIAVGSSNWVGGGDVEWAVARFDENGCDIWNHTFGVTGQIWEANSVALDSSNYIIVAGEIDNTDGVLRKYDQDGNSQWLISESNIPFKGVCTHGTDIYTVGDKYLIKYNNMGVKQWTKNIDNQYDTYDCVYDSSRDWIYTISRDTVGGYARFYATNALTQLSVWGSGWLSFPDSGPVVHGLDMDSNYDPFTFAVNTSLPSGSPIVSRKWNSSGLPGDSYYSACEKTWGTAPCDSAGGVAVDSYGNWHTIVYCPGEANRTRWLVWSGNDCSPLNSTTYPYMLWAIDVDTNDVDVMVGTTVAMTDAVINSLGYTSCVPGECNLLSVDVSEVCGGDECEQGEYVRFTGALSGSCNTSAIYWFQVDAEEDGLCGIQYTDGDMSGFWDTTLSFPTGTIVGTWEIPEITTDCIGKKVYGTYAAIYSDDPPETGTLMSDTWDVTGSVEFKEVVAEEMVDEVAMINATAWEEEGYGWAVPFFQTSFIYTMFMLLISGVAGALSKNAIAMGSIAIIMTVAYSVTGIYPVWIGVIVVVIVGLMMMAMMKQGWIR